MSKTNKDYIVTPEGTMYNYNKDTKRVKSFMDKFGNIYVYDKTGKPKKVDNIHH